MRVFCCLKCSEQNISSVCRSISNALSFHARCGILRCDGVMWVFYCNWNLFVQDGIIPASLFFDATSFVGRLQTAATTLTGFKVLSLPRKNILHAPHCVKCDFEQSEMAKYHWTLCPWWEVKDNFTFSLMWNTCWTPSFRKRFLCFLFYLFCLVSLFSSISFLFYLFSLLFLFSSISFLFCLFSLLSLLSCISFLFYLFSLLSFSSISFLFYLFSLLSLFSSISSLSSLSPISFLFYLFSLFSLVSLFCLPSLSLLSFFSLPSFFLVHSCAHHHDLQPMLEIFSLLPSLSFLSSFSLFSPFSLPSLSLLSGTASSVVKGAQEKTNWHPSKGPCFPSIFSYKLIVRNKHRQHRAGFGKLFCRNFLKFVFCLKTLAGQFFADVSKPLSGYGSFSSFGFASSGWHQQQNDRFLLRTIFANLPVDVFRVLFHRSCFSLALSLGSLHGVRNMEFLRHTSESDLV